MTQCELERELTRVTGESITTIRRRGFSIVEPPALEPLTVNWDALEAERIAIFPNRQNRRHTS